jgi:hypothetical protein
MMLRRFAGDCEQVLQSLAPFSPQYGQGVNYR